VILIDTSIWIDFFRGVPHPKAALLEQWISTEEDLCICGIILTEVLQGIRSNVDYRNTLRHFEHLIFLPLARAEFILAANLYRLARRKGVTLRNTTDCLIAACALSHRVPLLENDRDFRALAKISRLELV
jgi:predicted nucleic acid-binding protein